ncbi:hypothetical protein CMI41_04245 [Candidatus Pacearchaeota archaeon]|nr:hypothetical protein [Candidatus Pacearchaeota archaeon]|tara:strand:+ start:15814 stop:16365 length:552 start_codon:yes stop_codon:yes gene_type:complete
MEWLYFVAFLCAVYFFVISVLIHFVKRGYKFERDALSDAALGKKSFLMTSAFIIAGVSELIMAYKFWLSGYNIPSFFILLTGLGVILVGIVRLRGPPMQIMLHDFGAILVFLAFPIGLISYSIITRGNYFHLVIGTLNLLLFPVICWTQKIYRDGKFKKFGLIEKLDVFLINIWIVVAPWMKF